MDLTDEEEMPSTEESSGSDVRDFAAEEESKRRVEVKRGSRGARCNSGCSDGSRSGVRSGS